MQLASDVLAALVRGGPHHVGRCAVSESAALRELGALIESGGWRPLPGAPGMLIFIRIWPDDWVDALSVTDETDAFTERTNLAGHPVWRQSGALTEVIAALRGLPAPDAPTAPQIPIPSDHGGWS